MTDNHLTLFCLVDGEATSRAFSVDIDRTKSVGHLKKLVKSEKPRFDDIVADELSLWRISVSDDNQGSAVMIDALDDKTELNNPRTRLSELFPESPDDNTYIIVQRPPLFHTHIPARASTPLPDHLSDDSRPGTRLSESVETQDPPSTADRVLEKIRGRAIPLLLLFGVSGCGKTRTTIEMLTKNWGFYFNTSGTDWGSGDLLNFLALVQQRKQYQNRDLRSNTHVHILALALVLTRFMILLHCLNIAEHEGTTFTCKHWMLLQVGFRTMGVKDLFAILFTSIANEIHRHSIDITIMSAFACERFSILRQRLLNLTFNTPSQRFGYKILLVIDEAQNLGKEEFGTFLSQQIPSEAERRAGAASLDNYMRPILSPLVHGFYKISADKNMFCVIPCGNGLSILDMKWLEDAAPVPKGYQEQLGPFTDFQGWESLEQVQHYRDLVCCSLPNADARNIFNTHVPDESIPELFARLRGRFRPIVSAIERMIMPSNGRIDWRLAIKETEDMLSSTESRYYGKENIVFDISRMIRRAHNFESRYAKYQNIRTTLKAFVLEHYLHGRPLLLNKGEAPLVEASIGRILNFGEDTVTVLDEPFALRAAVNYFR
ncbi:hypothetical protein BG006_006990 [Podila minutissima]|uniref:Crinkler effector protein N-terminal domain-containing protein n=1 Tax=Podila minutissima TaxID=64525 RepID=A0A9P5VQJ4_9FUNG|nr:hypothetical protein BG006_006990 [Podila minutissima]